jgi:hypothetical protein
MFRFTIRDMLWLTILAAIALSWALDHGRLTTANRELTKQREAEQRFAQLRQRELQGKVIIGRFP